MRKLIVGDIHGNLQGLLDVIEKSGYDKDYDQLICLGDYVDGWSESAEVVDFLISLQNRAVHKPIFIRGNHDVWCDDYLRGRVDSHWLTQGGKATVASYQNNVGIIDYSAHSKFFRGLHNYYIDEENRAFVHGGFTSRRGVGHEPYHSNYYWDRDFWNLVTILHRTKDKPTNEHANRNERHKEIFIGHTATTGWNCKTHYPEYNHPNQLTKNGPITIPMNRLNVWNIDTGGGYVGKLTIMDIDSKEFWQSEFTKKYYPTEMKDYKK